MQPVTDIPIKWPKTTVALGALFTVISIALIFQLRAQTQLTAIFNPNNPSVKALQHTLKNFPVADQLLVMVTDENGMYPQKDLKEFVSRLDKNLSSANNSKLVKSLHYRAGKEFAQFFKQEMVPNAVYYLDTSGKKKLKKRLSKQGMTRQLENLRQTLLLPGAVGSAIGKAQSNDPLNLHELWQGRLNNFASFLGGDNLEFDNRSSKENGYYLFSKDKKSLLIRIQGAKPPGDIKFSKQLVSFVKRQVAKSNSDNLQVQIAGAYAVASYDASKIKSDVIWELITTIAGIIVLLIILYRRPIRLCLFAFVPVGLGVVWGFGIYALVFPAITPLAAVIGGALCGIGIDYPIHFLVHYQTNRKTNDAKQAAKKTLAHLGKPTFVAWFTSVLGFGAVGISPIGILRDFAIIGSLGLLGVGLATFVLLPAVLVLLDKNNSILPALPQIDLGLKVSRLITKRPLYISSLSLALAIVAIVYATGLISGFSNSVGGGGGGIGLSSNLMQLHPMPNPPLEAQRQISAAMNLPSNSLFLHLQATSPDKLLTLAYKVQSRLNSKKAQDSGIVGSFGLAALLPNPKASNAKLSTKKIKQNFKSALISSGYQPKAFSKYLKFVLTIINPKSTVTINDLLKYPQIAQLILPSSALEGKPATEALTMVKLDKSLDNRADRAVVLNGLAISLGNLHGVTVSGPAALSANVQSSMYKFLPWQIVLALVLIFICLLWYSHSLVSSLLILAPTVFAALFVFVYMTLTGAQINIINGVMAPVLLGITVDYGVFALAMSKSSDNKNLSPVSAAAITCAATTIIGWGSLITTSIPAVRSLGILIVVGVTAGLFGTLFMLLPLLIFVRDRAWFNRK